MKICLLQFIVRHVIIYHNSNLCFQSNCDTLSCIINYSTTEFSYKVLYSIDEVKQVNVISITYKSANCFLIPSNDGWVMIDTGWPDTLSQLLQLLNQNSISINEVNYLIITHYHPAHAGLAQNLKDLGIHLILHESQLAYFNRLNLFYKKNPQAHFRDITNINNIILNNTDSISFFQSIGLEAELISTPVHSDDSISLIVNNNLAFIGDLPPIDRINIQPDFALQNSWDLIHHFNVKKIYPGHGNSYEI